MSNILKHIILSVFIVFSVLSTNGQNSIRYGTPLYQNFSPKDYEGHPQLWYVQQIKSGLMILGCNNGALLFDGIHWQHLSKISYPRCLLNDTSTGKIFFGGDGNFGQLEFTSIGKPIVSLFSDSLSGKDKDYYTILSIVKKGNKLYFVGLKRIFIYENNKLVTSIGTETDFRFAFTPENQFFIRQSNVGLMAIDGDMLIKVPQSEIFGDEGIYFILPYDNSHYLLGSKNHGLFLFDKNYLHAQKVFTPISTPISGFLEKNKIGNGILLHDGRIAIGTNLGGIVILNHDLSPHLFFNQNLGLVNNGVNDIYQDKDHNLWIMTNNGFSVLFYGNPINKFYKKITGSQFLNVTLDIRNNDLFVGTMGGITKYTLSNYLDAKIPQSFISIKENNEIQTQVMFLTHQGNQILASTRDGIYQIDPNHLEATIVDSVQFNFTGHFSQFDTNYFFNGSLYGIDILHYKNGFWKKQGHIPLNNEVRYITEKQKGVLYASTARTGIFKIEIPNYDTPDIHTVKQFGKKDSIYEQKNVFFFKNDVYAIDIKKIYKFSPKQNNFIDITKNLIRYRSIQDTNILPNSFNSNILEAGHRYFSPNNKGNICEVLVTDSCFYISNYPFRNIISTGYFQSIDDTARQCIWFVGPSGLYNYYYNQADTKKTAFSAYIYRVTIGKDSTIAMNNILNAIQPIPYQFNTIRFDFSALFFENPDKTQYSYFLEGFDKQWSPLTSETFTKYTNLPFGTYTFKVKANNVYGDESLPASFTFTILAPWYMRWWLFIIYAIIIILLVRFIIFLNVKRLKAVNIKLEKIVNERTAEIKEKNIELENKNKLITNSIHYAKKIQDAIIPSEETLKKHFPDSFLYFLPRDIVSGDFFWIYSIDKFETIIALADCTGHGVPGAFMSMIGNTSLNEIIKEKKLFSPAEILQKLHMSIVNALQTHNESEVAEDGMDIVISKINTQKKEIIIAGANLNAFLYTDDNFVDFSSTILSIGDPFAKKQEVVFEEHQFKYTNTFKLYLTSDGYYDQFGNNEDKKFTLTRFLELIDRIHNLDIEIQKQEIHKTFESWKGNRMQIDDVLVIGIKNS